VSQRLPPLQGIDLSGRPVIFPQDLPPIPTVLLIAFQEDSRPDVKAWKRALDAAGVPWMSLPTSPEDVPQIEALDDGPGAPKGQGSEDLWTRTVMIHTGGPALLSTFGWAADLTAKVLLVLDDATVLFAHGGPFSEEAATALMEAI
jgi:hypothetical protein